MNKCRIVFADEHQFFIEALSDKLMRYSEIEIVKHLNKEADILSFLRKDKAIDIVISDLPTTGFNGMLMLKELRLTSPYTKVIFLSMYREPALIKTLLENGLWSYILKDSSFDEIKRCIDNAIHDKKYNCTQTQEILKKFALVEQNTKELTKREREILLYISMEVKNKKIADLLNVEVSTIESHKKNIMKKLGIESSMGLVKYAIKINLV
jgi:two-component system nitrate/nitrite response regulator NarL